MIQNIVIDTARIINATEHAELVGTIRVGEMHKRRRRRTDGKVKMKKRASQQIISIAKPSPMKSRSRGD